MKKYSLYFGGPLFLLYFGHAIRDSASIHEIVPIFATWFSITLTAFYFAFDWIGFVQWTPAKTRLIKNDAYPLLLDCLYYQLFFHGMLLFEFNLLNTVIGALFVPYFLWRFVKL